jgi:cytochrome c oxidase cbb3-type subunit I/II
MGALRTVGVPYTDGEIETAQESIAAQAKKIEEEIVSQQGPAEVAGKEIISLVAYLQRLGVDIKWERPLRTPLADQMEPVAAKAGEQTP